MIVANESDRRRLLQFGDTRGLASLPIVLDCQTWWREWGPKILAAEGRQGWILFILDAHEKLMEVMVTLSRVMRNKAKWTEAGWTAKEWLNIQDVCEGAQAWFEQNCPDPDSVPEYAQFILSMQYGQACVLRRMGRELRALQVQGYTTVVLETDGHKIACTEGGHKFMQEVG